MNLAGGMIVMNRLRGSMLPIATRLRLMVPKIGARTLKTCVAIAFSVMTARYLHLAAPQFAGIVSVLAVQPSVYRSLRHGFQQLLSALLGAGAAVLALYAFGPSALTFSIVPLLLMGLHVRWHWTNSLLVAVVIAVNTIGAQGMSYLHGGLNQLALVGIGIGYGNAINLLFRPTHRARSGSLLASCEKSVFQLIRVVHRDLERGIATPYPVFRRTIDRVRESLEEGKRIAGYVREDQRYGRVVEENTLDAFHALESMVERVRDMNKTLQRLSNLQRRSDLVRLAALLLRIQRRIIWGKPCHFHWVDAAYANVEARFYRGPLPATHERFVQQATEYHLFMFLKEYYGKLKDLRVDSRHALDAAHIG
jgi:uncharacterized membrane protein YgaE (UPF0421/DUF939 family)